MNHSPNILNMTKETKFLRRIFSISNVEITIMFSTSSQKIIIIEAEGTSLILPFREFADKDIHSNPWPHLPRLEQHKTRVGKLFL